MKTVSLIKAAEKIIVNGKELDVDISTTELLRTIINNPVQGGFSVSEMMNRLKLLEIVEDGEKNNKPEIQFEDSDFTLLGKLAQETKWNILSKTIIAFTKQFN